MSMEQTPRALKDRPVLDKSLGFFYEAFNELSVSRPFGQAGPLPIPISEVLAYCKLYEIRDIDFRTTLLSLVRQMDAHYINSAMKSDTKPENP